MEALELIYIAHFVLGTILLTFFQYINCRIPKIRILLFLFLCNIAIFTFFFGVLGPFLTIFQIETVNNFTVISFIIYFAYTFFYLYIYHIYKIYIYSIVYITTSTLCIVTLFNFLYISASWHPEANGFTWNTNFCLDKNLKYYYISNSLESICLSDSKNETKVLLNGHFSYNDFLWPIETNDGAFDICLIKGGLRKRIEEIIIVDHDVSALFPKFNHPPSVFIKSNNLKIPIWGGFLPSLCRDPSITSNIFIYGNTELNGNLSDGSNFSCGFYSPFFYNSIHCPVLINNKTIGLSAGNKIVFIDTETKMIKSEYGLNPLFFLTN